MGSRRAATSATAACRSPEGVAAAVAAAAASAESSLFVGALGASGALAALRAASLPSALVAPDWTVFASVFCNAPLASAGAWRDSAPKPRSIRPARCAPHTATVAKPAANVSANIWTPTIVHNGRGFDTTAGTGAPVIAEGCALCATNLSLAEADRGCVFALAIVVVPTTES